MNFSWSSSILLVSAFILFFYLKGMFRGIIIRCICQDDFCTSFKSIKYFYRIPTEFSEADTSIFESISASENSKLTFLFADDFYTRERKGDYFSFRIFLTFSRKSEGDCCGTSEEVTRSRDADTSGVEEVRISRPREGRYCSSKSSISDIHNQTISDI